jgi:cell division protein FtsX
MLRLIFLMLFVTAFALAATALVAFVTQTGGRTAPRKEDTMPQTFRKIAYVLLVVLMFGVVTGWLGAA